MAGVIEWESPSGRAKYQPSTTNSVYVYKCMWGDCISVWEDTNDDQSQPRLYRWRGRAMRKAIRRQRYEDHRQTARFTMREPSE